MKICGSYGDIALNNRIWSNRVSFVEKLPVSLKDSKVEVKVKVGGRYYPIINVYPKRGIAEYVGFENLNLKDYEIIIPTKRDQFQTALIGPKETYYFHTRSRAFERYGMEQKEYYESTINSNQD